MIIVSRAPLKVLLASISAKAALPADLQKPQEVRRASRATLVSPKNRLARQRVRPVPLASLSLKLAVPPARAAPSGLSQHLEANCSATHVRKDLFRACQRPTPASSAPLANIKTKLESPPVQTAPPADPLALLEASSAKTARQAKPNLLWQSQRVRPVHMARSRPKPTTPRAPRARPVCTQAMPPRWWLVCNVQQASFSTAAATRDVLRVPWAFTKPGQAKPAATDARLARLPAPRAASSVKAALPAQLKLWLANRRASDVERARSPMLVNPRAVIASLASTRAMARWLARCATREASRALLGLLRATPVLRGHIKTKPDKHRVSTAMSAHSSAPRVASSAKAALPAQLKRRLERHSVSGARQVGLKASAGRRAAWTARVTRSPPLWGAWRAKYASLARPNRVRDSLRALLVRMVCTKPSPATTRVIRARLAATRAPERRWLPARCATRVAISRRLSLLPAWTARRASSCRTQAAVRARVTCALLDISPLERARSVTNASRTSIFSPSRARADAYRAPTRPKR